MFTCKAEKAFTEKYTYLEHQSRGGYYTMKNMTSSDYNRFLAAIKAANDSEDRDALRQIQKQLISIYGAADDDVDYLIRQFRYHI